MSTSRFTLAALTAVMVTVSAADAQTPMVASTKDFISAAAQSDHFEILEAQTAVAQTNDPRVRAFAQDMIRDHMATSRTLAQAVMRSGMGPLPKGLGGDQQKLLGALQSQRGQAFDRTYAKQQVLAHDQALVVEQEYAAHGSTPEIQAAARSAVPIIQNHLEMAKRLKSDVDG